MKVLITNPDTIIDKSGNYFPDIVAVLTGFQNLGNKVLVVSINNRKLTTIDPTFMRHCVTTKERMGVDLIDKIKDKYRIDISDILVLGCKTADIALSANSKALLLRADYAKSGNECQRIFIGHYGVPISSPETLRKFLQICLSVKEPWFYKNIISKHTTIYSLINANTYRVGGSKELKLIEDFQSYLKNGVQSYRDTFLMFYIASLYRIVKEVENVDIWCYFPSSGIDPNESLEYFTNKARTLFRVHGKNGNLLIRSKVVEKRHKLGKVKRLREGCMKQFDSLKLSDSYGDISGKTICVLDDYTTYGTSCETVRHIFEAFGVEKLIFITLGKFGNEYYKYNYNLNDSEYNSWKIKNATRAVAINGQFNSAATIEFIKSLKDNI